MRRVGVSGNLAQPRAVRARVAATIQTRMVGGHDCSNQPVMVAMATEPTFESSIDLIEVTAMDSTINPMAMMTAGMNAFSNARTAVMMTVATMTAAIDMAAVVASMELMEVAIESASSTVNSLEAAEMATNHFS